MVFVTSNIVKSNPIGNSSGKILKTIVTKKLGKYNPYNFYDEQELMPLEYHNFQTIEIKFMSLTGEELQSQNPNDGEETHCHFFARRFKKQKIIS